MNISTILFDLDGTLLPMENGDIKEVGNHDELMKMNGKYAVLYNSQFA